MKPLLSRPFTISVVILIMAIAAIRQISHGEAVPLRKELASFPLELGPYKGHSVPFKPNVVEKLKVDDYLNRVYYQESQSERPVQLYVGYYETQRKGATYHSPQNCLPGSGWEMMEAERVQINAALQPITVNKVVIQKGLDRYLVLYWYQDRGRVIASEYWAKIYLVWDAITKNQTNGALVRVLVPVSQQETVDRAFEEGVVFVQRIFLLLGEYLPT